MIKRVHLKVGDIVRCPVKDGFIFAQYLGKDKTFGDAWYVDPVPRKVDDNKLREGGFVAFAMIKHALKDGIATVIGWETPITVIPRRFKDYLPIGDGIWKIEDLETNTISSSQELQLGDKALPLNTIFSYEFFIELVCSGWRPETGRPPEISWRP